MILKYKNYSKNGITEGMKAFKQIHKPKVEAIHAADSEQKFAIHSLSSYRLFRIYETKVASLLSQHSQPEYLTFEIKNDIVEMYKSSVDDVFYTFNLKEKSFVYNDILKNEIKTSIPTSMMLELLQQDEWKLEIDMQVLPDERKNILGYHAHKVRLVENRINIQDAASSFKVSFELFVTPEIPLPAWVVLGLWHDPSIGCPLYVEAKINVSSVLEIICIQS